jgi:hypothetical protein
MFAIFDGSRHGYHISRQAGFTKPLALRPSKKVRKMAAMLLFRIKIVMGSIAVVVCFFLMTLSILDLYDRYHNIVTH